MILELTPEQQEILEEATRSGRSREEVIDQAFTFLRQSLEMDNRLSTHRQEVVAHIEEGLAQAECSELIPDYEVTHILQERKQRRKIA